eukprot:15469507-Alexandrium_andersonii.AAC.1
MRRSGPTTRSTGTRARSSASSSFARTWPMSRQWLRFARFARTVGVDRPTARAWTRWTPTPAPGRRRPAASS